MDLLVEIKCNVMLNQQVTGISRHVRVFHLKKLNSPSVDALTQNLSDIGRVKLVHFRREHRRPSWLAISRTGKQDHPGTVIEHWRLGCGCFLLRKCKQKN